MKFLVEYPALIHRQTAFFHQFSYEFFGFFNRYGRHADPGKKHCYEIFAQMILHIPTSFLYSLSSLSL